MNSFISTNQELRQGDTLVSVNKKFKAVFQTDSNFVVYGDSGPIWASGTWHKDGYRILVQEENNLVMYTEDNKAVWESNPPNDNSKSDQMRLTMTNDGHLVLDKEGKEIWKSPPKE